MNQATDPTQVDAEKLLEALQRCRRELAQLRGQQEGWEEQFSRLRTDARESAEQSANLAGALAGYLADAYWRSRGQIAPIPLRTFIASRWPSLRKLFGGTPPPDAVTEMQQVRLIEASPAFDARWYLEHNPDVAKAGIHPALHYLLAGGPEGREPGPDFDTRAYRHEHPEMDEGTNPLLHYVQSRGG